MVPVTLSHTDGALYLPPLMNIYTRTGDSGQTALFGGGRVGKDHLRVIAYGDVDELNSTIGCAVATDPIEFEVDLFETIQRDLFSIGGLLAAPNPTKVAHALEKATLSASRITEFEGFIDEAMIELPPIKAFILPGGTPKAAALHLSRTVCRRAERQVVALSHEPQEIVPDNVLIYLNRLSDLLFVLARLANHRQGVADIIW